jgi:hypothetical protein
MESQVVYFKTIAISLCFLGTFLTPGFCGDSIEIFIKGYVFDINSRPINNALISLQNSGISAQTDSLGSCTIYKKVPAGIRASYKVQQAYLPAIPVLRPDGLYFSVAGSSQSATISFFSLSGRKIKDIAQGDFAPGNYRINPFSLPLSSQPCILRAQIGELTSIFRVAMCGVRPAIGNASIKRLEGKSPTFGLSKRAVFLDKIVASAANYDPETRPLDSTDGDHYFFLRQAGTTAGKHLDITFSFNEIQDPVPSFLTAMWLEDSNKVRQQTLFVSRWLSDEGYRRTGICPDWLGPDSTYWATERTSNTTLVDAVTHATPIKGKNSFNTIIGASQKTVRCCIETHVDGVTNILYSATMNLQQDSAEAVGTVTYVPSRAIDIDALSTVVFKVHK